MFPKSSSYTHCTVNIGVGFFVNKRSKLKDFEKQEFEYVKFKDLSLLNGVEHGARLRKKAISVWPALESPPPPSSPPSPGYCKRSLYLPHSEKKP
jgi:hypothetical protein